MTALADAIALAIDVWHSPPKRRRPEADIPSRRVVRLGIRGGRFAALEENRAWFEANREVLRSQFPDAAYIAVWQGTAIGSGNSLADVADKVLAIIGRNPVYIGCLLQTDNLVDMSP
jgi:hypothetical protein